MIIFDIDFNELNITKNKIIDLIEYNISLGVKIEYNLKGIIAVPFFNHYNCIKFHPQGITINSYFEPNKNN